jgi:hypothetical protein
VRWVKCTSYRYLFYLGKIAVCPSCGKPGYVEVGQIMRCVMKKVSHRRRIGGKLRYSGVCYI